MTGLDVDPPAGVTLRPILKFSSVGPPPDVVALAAWAAQRWAGRRSAVLKTASSPRQVRAVGPPRPPTTAKVEAVDEVVRAALAEPLVTALRVAPTDDHYEAALAAASLGNVLVVCPEVGQARRLAGRLGRAGVRVHLQPGAWASGTGGGTVIGARSAVFAPTGRLAAVVVLDEHDEALQEERNPTWHARDVAIERARRSQVPCLLVSPTPSLSALDQADRVRDRSRSEIRKGWAPVEAIDRRQEEPGRLGLFSERVVRIVGEADRVVAVLNRKGRAVMLACGSCGELVRTEDGTELMVEQDGELVAPRTGERRPLICAVCTGTGLKRLRLGVTRAAEELTRLVGRPVVEWSTDTRHQDRSGVVLGTEAVLHGDHEADVVVFLDFDQELHAPRYRAAEQAMVLLARASRMVGGRRPGARILAQTRTPDHRVLRAAGLSDTGRFVDEEMALRRGLGLPPATALAEISGPGAARLLEPAADLAEAEVLGPRDDGRYLLRAPDAVTLAAILADFDRPPERVRVAVDPPRV